MNKYAQTKEDYEKGVEWHIQKSSSYDWKKQIYRFIKQLEGKKVLDAGCGGGRDIEEFFKKRIQADGLDYSKLTIEKCREKFPELDFYVADLRKTGLPTYTYDGIWSCASLLNLKKIDAPIVLSEFRRIMKPKGILFVSVKEGKGEKMISDQAGQRFFSFYSLDELKKLVEKAGFKVVFSEIVSDAELTGESPKQAKPDWICLYAVKSKISK